MSYLLAPFHAAAGLGALLTLAAICGLVALCEITTEQETTHGQAD